MSTCCYTNRFKKSYFFNAYGDIKDTGPGPGGNNWTQIAQSYYLVTSLTEIRLGFEAKVQLNTS